MDFFELVKHFVEPHNFDPNFRVVHIGYDVSGFRFGHWTIGIGSSTPSSPFELFVVRDDGWWDRLADRSYDLIIYETPHIDFPRLFGLRNLVQKGKNGALFLARCNSQELRVLKHFIKNHQIQDGIFLGKIDNKMVGTYFRSVDGLGDAMQVRPSIKKMLNQGPVTIECDYKHKWFFDDLGCNVVGAIIRSDHHHQYNFRHDACVHKPSHQYVTGAMINCEFPRLKFGPLFGHDDIQTIAWQTGSLLTKDEMKQMYIDLPNPNPRFCVLCLNSVNNEKSLDNHAILHVIKLLQQKGFRPIVLQSLFPNEEPIKTQDGTIIIRSKLSSTQVKKLMRHCNLFIGLDSGFSHISSMFKIPTIVFCNQHSIGRWQHYEKTRVCLTQGPIRGVLPSSRSDKKVTLDDIDWNIFSKLIDEFQIQSSFPNTLEKIKMLKPDSIFDIIPRNWFINNPHPTPENGHLFSKNCYEWNVALNKYYKPESLLEIGTHWGFSLGAFLKGFPSSSFMSVDNESYYDHTQHIAKMLMEALGFSHGEYKTVDSLSLFELPRRFDFAYVDGDHSVGGAKHDGYLCKRYADVIAFDDYQGNISPSLEDPLSLWVVDNLDDIENFYHIPSFNGILVVEMRKTQC